MDYVCSPVILYSQDKVRMMDFLSDVLEFDVNPELDLIQNGPLHLKLIELPELEKANFESRGIKFAFKLKTYEDLKEIVNKYNFFLYRTIDKDSAKELCDVNLSGEYKSLSIKDIDGRVWQFDVEARL